MSRSLAGNRLKGTIPNLSNLSRIRLIDLSRNQLKGTFPDWMSNLRNLQMLNLGQNDIIEKIPATVGANLINFDKYLHSDQLPESFRPLLIEHNELFKLFHDVKKGDLFWFNPTYWAKQEETLTSILSNYLAAEKANLIFEKLHDGSLHTFDFKINDRIKEYKK